MSEPMEEQPPSVSHDDGGEEEERAEEQTIEGEYHSSNQEDDRETVEQLLDVDLNQLLQYHISFDNLTQVLNTLIKVAKNQDDDIKTRNKENEELKKEVDSLKATVSDNHSKLNDQDARLSTCEEGQQAMTEQINSVNADALQERIASLESQVTDLSKANEGKADLGHDDVEALKDRIGDLEEKIRNLEGDENAQRISKLEERMNDVEKASEENAQKVSALQQDVDKLPTSESFAAMLDSSASGGEGGSGGQTEASTLMKMDQLEKSLSRLERDFNNCATKDDLETIKGSHQDDTLASDIRSLQDQLKKHQREINRLKEDLEALDSTALGAPIEGGEHQGEEGNDSGEVSSQEIQALRRELNRGIKSVNVKINEVDEAFREGDQNLRDSLWKSISKNTELLNEIPEKLERLSGSIWQLRGENDELREPLSSLAKSAGVMAGESREELDLVQKNAIEKHRTEMGSGPRNEASSHHSGEDDKGMKTEERNIRVLPEIYGFKQLITELSRVANPKVNSDDIRTLRSQIGSLEDKFRSLDRSSNLAKSNDSDDSSKQKRSTGGLQEAEVSERVALCEEDMERYRRAIQKLRHEVKGLKSGLDDKVDKEDYDQLMQTVETKAQDDDLMALTKTVQDLIQRKPRRKQVSESKHEHQTTWESENAAAANRRLLPGYKCLVCDRPLEDFKDTAPKYVPRDELPHYQKDADFSFKRFHRPVTAASSTNRSLRSSTQRRPQSAAHSNSADPGSEDPYSQERAAGGKYTYQEVSSPDQKRLRNGQVIRRNSFTEETQSRPSSTRGSKRSSPRSPSVEAVSPRPNGELPEIS